MIVNQLHAAGVSPSFRWGWVLPLVAISGAALLTVLVLVSVVSGGGRLRAREISFSLRTQILIFIWALALQWALRATHTPLSGYMALAAHVSMLTSGLWIIFGLMAAGRNHLCCTIVNAGAVAEEPRKRLCELVRSAYLNAPLFLALAGAFFYLSGYHDEVRYLLRILDTKVYGTCVYTLPALLGLARLALAFGSVLESAAPSARSEGEERNGAATFATDLLRIMLHPHWWALVALVVIAASVSLQGARHSPVISSAIRILLYTYSFYLLFLASNLLPHFLPRGLNDRHGIVLSAIIKFAKLVVIVVGSTTILGLCGLNTTAIMASLGLSGAALAFAAKSSIENIISGFLILVGRPFEIGDLVQIGTLTKGKIVDLRLVYTELELADGTKTLVPNSVVSVSVLQITRPPSQAA